MLLSVRNVSVCHGKVEAVKGVSIDVEERSVVALIGANGAGKTTLLRTISGLKTPAKGEIWLSEQRIDGLRPERIVGMGVAHVPEGRRVFSNMTVFENLMMGAYRRRRGTAIAEDLSSVCRYFPVLWKRKRQLAGTLSGGEQQMLSIGRALMSRPKLLLLDEPSIGLSPKVIDEIAEIVAAIHRDGMSVVLVEQNVPLALSLASKGYVLVTGSVALQGSNHELFNSDSVKKAFLGG